MDKDRELLKWPLLKWLMAQWTIFGEIKRDSMENKIENENDFRFYFYLIF